MFVFHYQTWDMLSPLAYFPIPLLKRNCGRLSWYSHTYIRPYSIVQTPPIQIARRRMKTHRSTSLLGRKPCGMKEVAAVGFDGPYLSNARRPFVWSIYGPTNTPLLPLLARSTPSRTAVASSLRRGGDKETMATADSPS